MFAVLLLLGGIEIWHGATQRVGHLGDAQTDFNVMGHVEPWREIDRLTWRIGEGNQIPLSFRSYRRLVAEGDFNADIPIPMLRPGANTVTIRAAFRDGRSEESSITVVREERAGSRPPLRVRWGEVSDPQAVGQYVDGRWNLTPAGLRTAQVGYDRVFLIGQRDWRDYRVRATLTVHGASPGTTPLSGGNGVGIILRFAGHVTGGPRNFPSGQPKWGYQPFGAIGWLRWPKDGPKVPPQKQFYPGGNDRSHDHGAYPLRFGTPYRMTFECAGARYRFRIWEASAPEPETWDWEEVQTDPVALTQGGFALLAHHTDVTFGDIDVEPIP